MCSECSDAIGVKGTTRLDVTALLHVVMSVAVASGSASNVVYNSLLGIAVSVMRVCLSGW